MATTKLNSSQVLRSSFNETDGALNVTSTNSFITSRFDTITKNNVSSTIEDYIYSLDSNMVGTVRVTYVDSTKADIVSVQKIL